MKIGRFAMLLDYLMIAVFVLMGAGPARMLAQEDHTHMNMSQERDQSEQKNQASALIKVVRESVSRTFSG